MSREGVASFSPCNCSHVILARSNVSCACIVGICANRNRVLVRSSRAFMVPPLALHTFGIKAIYRKYCHGESELPRDGFKPDRDLGGRSRPVTAVSGRHDYATTFGLNRNGR